MRWQLVVIVVALFSLIAFVYQAGLLNKRIEKEMDLAFERNKEKETK